ncbi:hypothetical protein [Caminibacter pacificus]|uniref:KH domain-containing protein n=1 Tax=Caminibacter pacificus TaxID=1424653 RepID=A0AAJ4RAK1_9BACT|nr:hypothetical protein [Caminibacter pacificus]QDD68179.1 hypothetical protein C6V80_10010 [Caminibacter pacificus]ROR38692.1 hypothetical protein EDC58_1907 [Caminibacter pacificus]
MYLLRKEKKIDNKLLEIVSEFKKIEKEKITDVRVVSTNYYPISKEKIENVNVKEIIVEWVDNTKMIMIGEYNNFYGIKFVLSLIEKEGDNLLEKDGDFYLLSKKNKEKLKEYALKKIRKGLTDEVKNKIAKNIADYPVSFTINLNTFEYIIKYHPVDNYCGDEWRGGDCLRSVVDDKVVKEDKGLLKIEDFYPLFTLEEIMQFLTPLGRKRALSIKPEELKKDKKLYKYALSLIKKSAQEDYKKYIQYLLRKKEEKNTIKAFEAYRALRKEGIKIEKNEKFEKCLKAKSFLIQNGGNYFVTDDLFSNSYGEILECFEDDVFLLKDALKRIDNKLKNTIIENILKELNLKKNQNYFVCDNKWRELEVLKELNILNIKQYEAQLSKKFDLRFYIVINDINNPEFVNKTNYATGTLIGKGGSRIKEIAKEIGVKFIKLVKEVK